MTGVATGRTIALDLSRREVTVASSGVDLAGTLVMPAGTRPLAASLVLSGPGRDRDGNRGLHHPDVPRQLAGAMTEVSIASLRYDARGVGASGGARRGASAEAHLRDAQAALRTLRAHAGIDPTRLLLVGHGAGCDLAVSLAALEPSIAGVALVGGALRPLLAEIETPVLLIGDERDQRRLDHEDLAELGRWAARVTGREGASGALRTP